MNKQIESLEHLENELSRYNEQKEALEKQQYPKDQEDSKQQLLKFYYEQIKSLQARIDICKAEPLEFEAETIQANQTKRQNSNEL